MSNNEKLIYENEKGQSIEFSIFSPFFATKIEGLDGLKNNIYTSKSMGQDGVTYIASNLDIRNVNVEGAIIENIDFNRDKLLTIINPKLDGKLIYEKNGIRKYISCKVERAPVITKDFSPQFLVGFYCPSPYWYDEEYTINIAQWKNNFEFPLELLSEGLEFGLREPSLIVNIINKCDVELGIKIEFKALGTVVNPSLFNVNTREFIKVNKEMKQGEIIAINTTFGNKKVESSNNGIRINALNYIDWQSTFLQLHTGDNLFRYDAEQNLDNLEVSICYSNLYVGV